MTIDLLEEFFDLPKESQKPIFESLKADSKKLGELLKSDTIQLVYHGKYTPKDLDNAIKNMKKKIVELEHLHQLDMAEIVTQRRQIDFLVERKDD